MLSRLFSVLLIALLALPAVAFSDDDGDREEAERLPFSDLSFPEPQRHFSATQKCVEPVEVMRHNHMNFLKHQRDATMHEGIRTRRYSIEECINCHAVKDEAGEYIPVNAPDQFCSSCHEYASVHLDCFQCHNTKPVRPSMLQPQQSGTDPHRHDASDDAHQLLASESKDQ